MYVYMHVHTHVQRRNANAYVNTCIYICIWACIHTYVYVFMGVHIYGSTLLRDTNIRVTSYAVQCSVIHTYINIDTYSYARHGVVCFHTHIHS